MKNSNKKYNDTFIEMLDDEKEKEIWKLNN